MESDYQGEIKGEQQHFCVDIARPIKKKKNSRSH